MLVFVPRREHMLGTGVIVRETTLFIKAVAVHNFGPLRSYQ
jgi:hypothetical protein